MVPVVVFILLCQDSLAFHGLFLIKVGSILVHNIPQVVVSVVFSLCLCWLISVCIAAGSGFDGRLVSFRSSQHLCSINGVICDISQRLAPAAMFVPVEGRPALNVGRALPVENAAIVPYTRRDTDESGRFCWSQC